MMIGGLLAGLGGPFFFVPMITRMLVVFHGHVIARVFRLRLVVMAAAMLASSLLATLAFETMGAVATQLVCGADGSRPARRLPRLPHLSPHRGSDPPPHRPAAAEVRPRGSARPSRNAGPRLAQAFARAAQKAEGDDADADHPGPRGVGNPARVRRSAGPRDPSTRSCCPARRAAAAAARARARYGLAGRLSFPPACRE